MPLPSSSTEIEPSPPSRIATRICVAPASSAFSTSSFTTEAGRSTTSPAAIWFTSSPGRIRIGAITPNPRMPPQATVSRASGTSPKFPPTLLKFLDSFAT